MTAIIICLLVVLVSAVIIVEGYRASQQVRLLHSFRLAVRPDSYKQALENASLAKAQKSGQAIPVPPVRQPVVSSSSAVAPIQTPSQSFDTEVEDNGLPFTDEMYDHLKFVISKLSTRMKSDIPLSKDDLVRFEQSCEAIIRDAKGSTWGPSTAGTSF